MLVDFGAASPHLVPLIGFALGVAVGRWWIVPVPLLLAVAHIPVEHSEAPPWMMALFFLSLPMCVAAFVGVAVGKIGGRAVRHARGAAQVPDVRSP